jgi:hypothetical protein
MTIAQGNQIRLASLGVHHHGAELEHGEWLAVASDANLAEDRRSTVLNLCHRCDPKHRRESDQQAYRCQCDVTESF